MTQKEQNGHKTQKGKKIKKTKQGRLCVKISVLAQAAIEAKNPTECAESKILWEEKKEKDKKFNITVSKGVEEETMQIFPVHSFFRSMVSEGKNSLQKSPTYFGSLCTLSYLLLLLS